MCLAGTHPGAAAGVAAWALALALSRAAMGRHYLSDVAAGLLVGVATTGIVTRCASGRAGERRAGTMLPIDPPLQGWLARGLARRRADLTLPPTNPPTPRRWQFARYGFWLQQPGVDAAYATLMRWWGALAARIMAL